MLLATVNLDIYSVSNGSDGLVLRNILQVSAMLSFKPQLRHCECCCVLTYLRWHGSGRPDCQAPASCACRDFAGLKLAPTDGRSSCLEQTSCVHLEGETVCQYKPKLDCNVRFEGLPSKRCAASFSSGFGDSHGSPSSLVKP